MADQSERPDLRQVAANARRVAEEAMAIAYERAWRSGWSAGYKDGRQVTTATEPERLEVDEAVSTPMNPGTVTWDQLRAMSAEEYSTWRDAQLERAKTNREDPPS